MSDISILTIDCTAQEVSVERQDLEIVSGVGVGGMQPIKDGKSFLIAQILQEVSKLLIDETEEDLKTGLIEARRGMKDV